MTLTTYIKQVDEAISDLTNGVLYLDAMTDFSDGEFALDEMHFANVPPRVAARSILWANGMADALVCWSDECDFCAYMDDCPHIC